jgi:hypothetical protein
MNILKNSWPMYRSTGSDFYPAAGVKIGSKRYFLIIDIADTAQKGGGFVCHVFHAVGLHARDIDRSAGLAHHFFLEIIGFFIKFPALEFTGQNIHGLVVKMIVDGNLPPRLDGEKPQPVFRNPVFIFPML